MSSFLLGDLVGCIVSLQQDEVQLVFGVPVLCLRRITGSVFGAFTSHRYADMQPFLKQAT